MKSEFAPLSQTDAPSYSFHPHAFTRKLLHWQVCRWCGMARLNNLLTDWCVKMGCDAELHTSWSAQRVRLPLEHRKQKGRSL